MKWLTECEVPEGVEKRMFVGSHLQNAIRCLVNGFEDNAASWLQYEIECRPVAGTLELAQTENGQQVIRYFDAEDIENYVEGRKAQERLNELREKVVHGTPGLTINEQRELIRLAGGKPIEKKRRCLHCDGVGSVVVFKCPTCEGEGYFTEGVY